MSVSLRGSSFCVWTFRLDTIRNPAEYIEEKNKLSINLLWD